MSNDYDDSLHDDDLYDDVLDVKPAAKVPCPTNHSTHAAAAVATTTTIISGSVSHHSSNNHKLSSSNVDAPPPLSLTEQVQMLQKRVMDLEQENDNLQRNIGILYRTAKAELQRKDDQIDQLMNGKLK